MRIAANSANLVATNAQRFSCTAMTTRADVGFPQCCRSVIITSSWQTEPAIRVGVCPSVFCSNTFARVTRAAYVRRMTRRAEARIRAGFVTVSRDKPRTMNTQASRVIKKLSFGQQRCRYTMTTQTKTFGMTIHAQLPLRRGTNSVFAHEISSVNQVVVGTNAFVAQIDMAGIATILGEVFFMRVATAAGGHAGAEDVGAVGDIDVTAHAIAWGARDVCSVLETQMLSSHFGAVAGLGQTVAAVAFVFVVRFFMTIEAILCRGQMQRSFVTGRCGAGMTAAAMNSFDDVRAVFEGSSSGWSKSQNGCASGRKEEARAEEERCRFGFHGPLHVWARRTIPCKEAVVVGEALASRALDISQYGTGV